MPVGTHSTLICGP